MRIATCFLWENLGRKQPEENVAQSESTDVKSEAAEGNIEHTHEDIHPNNNHMENETRPDEMDIYDKQVQGLKREHVTDSLAGKLYIYR